MKAIIQAITLLLLSTVAVAQKISSDSLLNDVRSFYDRLDHSTMQTGYLLNRGFVVLNELEKWNDDIPVISNLERWKYIYNSIKASAYKPSSEMPEVSSLQKGSYATHFEGASIFLGLLNFKGDYLSPETIKQLAKHEKHPVYSQLNVFSGTVLQAKVYSEKVSFRWRPDYYFTNKEEDFSLYVDFGDEVGYRPLPVNTAQGFEVVYDCIGEKNIRFKYISATDTLISYSKLSVTALKPRKPTYIGEIKGEDIAPRAKQKRTDPNINLPFAEYAYYEGGDNVLDKPVIIAEGFDILGQGDAVDLHDKWTLLIDDLNNHGYDVFTLNFLAPNHAIANNAGIVKTLITEINNSKIGNFEGVYMGQSMGGVIGRIALKEMEDDGYDHQIGLYIAYDSPMKGASIPKGLQWLFQDAYLALGPSVITGTFFVELYEFIGGADVPVVDLYQQLQSTGARQLLARHFMGSIDYTNFQLFLAGLGYPGKCRNITFVNGSDDGDYLNGVTLGSKMFHAGLTIGLLDISAKAWYSNVNAINQKVSEMGYYNITTPWLTFSHTREEDFDSKPFDNAPGGWEQAGINSNGREFTFVPTVSGIDLKKSIFDTGNFAYLNKNEQSVISNGDVPFDDIYSDGRNNSHLLREYFIREDLGHMEFMYNDLYLQNRDINTSKDFEAQHSITIGNEVQPSNFSDAFDDDYLNNKIIESGDFVAQPYIELNLDAGDSILLKPGTLFKSGSEVNLNLSPNPTLSKRSRSAPIVSPEINGPKYICRESHYLGSASYEEASFEWKLVGEQTLITDSGEQFTPPNGLPVGQYTLYCTASGAWGSSSKSKVLVVSGDSGCSPFNSTVQNELPLIDDVSIEVYPNPTAGLVAVNLVQKDKAAYLSVRDAMGKVVINAVRVESGSTMLDLSNEPAGIYVIEIQTSSGLQSYKVMRL